MQIKCIVTFPCRYLVIMAMDVILVNDNATHGAADLRFAGWNGITEKRGSAKLAMRDVDALGV